MKKLFGLLILNCTIATTAYGANYDRGCFEPTKIEPIFVSLSRKILTEGQQTLVTDRFGTLMSLDADGQSTSKRLLVTTRKGYGSAVWRMKVNNETCEASFELVR